MPPANSPNASPAFAPRSSRAKSPHPPKRSYRFNKASRNSAEGGGGSPSRPELSGVPADLGRLGEPAPPFPTPSTDSILSSCPPNLSTGYTGWTGWLRMSVTAGRPDHDEQ